MSSLDFQSLLDQAESLAKRGQARQSIEAFLEITQLANSDSEIFVKGTAYAGAGSAAKEAVLDIKSSYYRDALSFFAEANQIFKDMDARESQSLLFTEIASTAVNASDNQTATQYFQKAIESSQTNEQFGNLSVSYSKLGLYHLWSGQVEEALSFSDRSLSIIKKQANAGFDKAIIILDRSYTVCKMNDYHLSLELLEEALGWFKADHGQKSYDIYLARIYGLTFLLNKILSAEKTSHQNFDNYQSIIKQFDPLVANLVEREIKTLVD